MKQRLYIAYWDDGHDRGDFTFYSSHRANSKPNLEDAYESYFNKYGYSRASKITITATCLY